MSDPITPGETVASRYVLQKLLGKGGQASVWLARDLRTQAVVALKLAAAPVRNSPVAMARLSQEAELLARLEHPHIARCLDFAVDVEQPYLAMEHVRGVSLGRELRLRAQGQAHFELGQIHEMFAQILSAVAYAHEQGVVHRDLKPDNLMFVETPRGISVKVLDLGVAKLLDQDSQAETTQGRVIGSLMYLSPEQAAGERVDPRSDIFSLGTILFEVLTLRRTWAIGEDGSPMPAFIGSVKLNPKNAPTEILSRILAPERPRPSRWRSRLPADLDAVVARALAVRRIERYPSASVFLEDLEQALGAAEPRTMLTVLASSGEESSGPSLEAAILALRDAEVARARLGLAESSAQAHVGTLTAGEPGASAWASADPEPSQPSGSIGVVDTRPPSIRPLLFGTAIVVASAMLAMAVSTAVWESERPTPLVPVDPIPTAVPKPSTVVVAPPETPARPEPAEEAQSPPAPGLTPGSSRRPRESAASKRAGAPPVVEAPQPPRGAKLAFPELSAQLEALRKDPTNLALFNRAGQAIVEAAEVHVREKAQRDRIKRLATASMRVADLAQLERALTGLEAAAE